MNRSLVRRLLVTALLLLAPTLQAQDQADAGRDPAPFAPVAVDACGSWGLWSLRGTYAFNASGWQDLSEINPALPKGYAPVSIVGAFKVDGRSGDLNGWASINAGGVPLTADFVDSRLGAPKADCSFPVTLSMRIKEFEGVVGPYAYAGVIAGHSSALEVVFMMLGTGPGSHVDLNRAKRISLKLN